ncbi:MAG: hypothetical protein KAH54_04150 [Candidatus Sabulitectum sp.]|nr:hypothetical protein [Candidatus Sabulitectum sp.]
MKHNPERRISFPDGVRWGELILPAKDETRSKNHEGLKVMAICSWTLGILAFETLKLSERRLPGKLNIVGLVTDDPTDKDAKISKKRRIWRYYDSEEQEEYERGVIESALTFGVPCYTGDVKCEFFRDLLKKWNPDLIVVCGFGQLIDQPIIDYPEYGIYNVHPADLLHHHGAGPQPWEDLVARKAETTRVTIHKVSTKIDSGDIVGQSSLINVRLKNNEFTDNVRLIGEKTLLPVDHMVAELVCRIIRRKNEGLEGAVDKIDFEKLFSQEFKNKLMEPIDPATRGVILPLPAEDIKFTV